MKRVFCASVILITFLNLRAQDDVFTIRQIGTTYSPEQITTAMNAADWCGFFYRDSQRVLKFDDGALVELKSASELAESSQDYTPSCTSGEEHVDTNIYSVHSTGRILIQVSNSSTVKTKPGVRSKNRE
jgi:hypothetical protein